jgi:hypothetical protein
MADIQITGVNKPRPQVITVAAIKAAKESKGDSGKAKVVPLSLTTDSEGNYVLTFPSVWEEGTVKMGVSGKSVSAYASTGVLGEGDTGNITLLDGNGAPAMSLPFRSIGFNIILPL